MATIYHTSIPVLRWAQRLLGIAFCLSVPHAAFADLAKQHQAYERVLLPSGRAALLGGAYTALADDPVGLLYNPGGSVFNEHSEVSLNTWSAFRSEVVYKGAVIGEDFKENSQARSGGFAGGLFQLKPFTLGYIVASLDKRNINQDDYFADLPENRGSISRFSRVHQESNSYDMIGSSVGLKLGSAWGVGVLLYVYDRSIEEMDVQKVEYTGGRVLVQQTKLKVSNQGLIGIAGIRYRGESCSLGLSVKQGEPLIDQASMGLLSVTQDTAGQVATVVETKDDSYTSEEELIPAIVRFGFAWHPSKAFLLSGDVQYSSLLESNNGSPDRLATFNYSLGLETGFTRLRFLAGVYTNNSVFPRNDPSRSQQAVHLDYVGQSLGMMFIAPAFDLSLGYVKQIGEGTSQITIGEAREEVSSIIEHFIASWNFKLK